MGRRQTKKEATQRKILDVSLGLFRKKGFPKTTMRDIAKKSRIALGTTYNYFPTKEHIALYFFDRALEQVKVRYKREVDAKMALDERLFLLISLELDQVAPYEEFLNVIVTQSVGPGSRLHPLSADSLRLKKHHLEFVGEILEEARRRGELPEAGLSSMMLSAYWVFHLGIMMFWLNDPSPKKEDTFILLDKSLRFILNALRGKTVRGKSRRKR